MAFDFLLLIEHNFHKMSLLTDAILTSMIVILDVSSEYVCEPGYITFPFKNPNFLYKDLISEHVQNVFSF